MSVRKSGKPPQKEENASSSQQTSGLQKGAAWLKTITGVLYVIGAIILFIGSIPALIMVERNTWCLMFRDIFDGTPWKESWDCAPEGCSQIRDELIETRAKLAEALRRDTVRSPPPKCGPRAILCFPQGVPLGLKLTYSNGRRSYNWRPEGKNCVAVCGVSGRATVKIVPLGCPVTLDSAQEKLHPGTRCGSGA